MCWGSNVLSPDTLSLSFADEVVPKKLAETKKFAGQKIVQASAGGLPLHGCILRYASESGFQQYMAHLCL